MGGRTGPSRHGANEPHADSLISFFTRDDVYIGEDLDPLQRLQLPRSSAQLATLLCAAIEHHQTAFGELCEG